MSKRTVGEDSSVFPLKVTWAWPTKPGTVLTDSATTAENRLKAIKRAAKMLKKSVEDSLRTSSRNKNEELEIRKKRSAEFVLGDNVAAAVHSLTADGKINEHCSPLNTVMERFANFEKTIGHMLAANEQEISTFLASDTPLSKLLNDDIPAVNAAKKELDMITKKQINAQSALDKETRRLEKMFTEEDVDHEVLRQQEDKTKKLLHEVDLLTKEASLEQDKLTTFLLTLVSRENRYAGSIMELMRIKKQFYEAAYNTISAELPNIERILQETQLRPVFGEPLADYLTATGRSIAFPISLAVTFLRQSGLNDEGLFRISTKQIKLEKLKAYIDAGLPFIQLLQDCDAHFYAALLKGYLRELPVAMLTSTELEKNQELAHERWIAVPKLSTKQEQIREIRYILKEELPTSVVLNIQYIIKFLSELTRKSTTNKMTPHNLGIVLGPTLLWRSCGGALNEQINIENVIKVISILIERYNDIFPVDISWSQYDEGTSKIVTDILDSPTNFEDSESATSPDYRSGDSGGNLRGGGNKKNNLRAKFLSKINSTFESYESSSSPMLAAGVAQNLTTPSKENSPL